jgi:hypothetical protein
MRVRSNNYRSVFMERLRAEFTGEWVDGGEVQTPLLDANTGILEAWWKDWEEFEVSGEGMVLPEGRTIEEAVAVNLVRHVVLEQLMTSQQTVGWGDYDTYYFSISRGFLREAVNRTDLSEGVLSLGQVHKPVKDGCIPSS